jgi:hypothetical protein
MVRRLFLTLVLLGALLLALPVGAAKSYRAETFDMDVTVLDDGTLEVTETIRFVFEGGPFTYVFRELPTQFSDAVVVTEALMDGAVLPEGAEAGEVEIEADGPINVTWHFAPTSDSSHTFTLRYRVEGTLYREAGGDVLEWQCLPNEHDYPIESASCRIDYPTGVSLLEEPRVTEGEAEVEVGDSAVTFSRSEVEPDGTFVVRLRFPEGSLLDALPQWQQREREVASYAPYFIGAAAALLVLGIAGVFLYWRRYHRSRPEPAPSVRLHELPADRAPAVAGVLYQRGDMDSPWNYVLATLFDLGRRGLITIEEIEAQSFWRKKDFVLHRHASPSDAQLRPHERGLLEALFRSKEGLQESLKLSDLENSAYSKANDFKKALKEELVAGGLFSARQRRGSNTLVWGGLALMILSLVLAIALTLIFVEQIGAWLMLIGGSLFVVGLAALIFGSTLSRLDDDYLKEAESWRRFGKYLKDVARGREMNFDRGLFERYLPYVAGFGFLQEWAKHFEKEEQVPVPDWFRPLAGATDTSYAFIAMLAAANSSGGSAAGTTGGAAGASAAGGGASGAG